MSFGDWEWLLCIWTGIYLFTQRIELQRVGLCVCLCLCTCAFLCHISIYGMAWHGRKKSNNLERTLTEKLPSIKSSWGRSPFFWTHSSFGQPSSYIYILFLAFRSSGLIFCCKAGWWTWLPGRVLLLAHLTRFEREPANQVNKSPNVLVAENMRTREYIGSIPNSIGHLARR